jgi:flagellar protein FlgJ
MTVASSTDGFALDMQGLANLKRQAQQDAAGGLKEASKQFEALFLQMMLKSMRAAIPESELSSGSQTKLYTEMFDQQLAQQLAGRGMGLSEQLTRHLSGGVPGAAPGVPAQDLQRGRVPQAPLFASVSPFAGSSSSASQQAIQAWQQRDGDTPAVGAREAGERPAHVEAFVSQLRGPAQRVAARSGIPAELIVAQAALETDWGRRQIKTGSGADSHNLFGIKAGSRWQGATTDVLTTEYEQGEPRKQVERFRVYPSYEAAFHDYAQLIQRNPNYAGVHQAGNASQAARALQDGGYATDPQYAQKLISVMARIGPLDGLQLAEQ